MATRDITEAQFREALRKHGIKQQAIWWFVKPGTDTWIGAVINAKTGRIDRRATLDKVLNYQE